MERRIRRLKWSVRGLECGISTVTKDAGRDELTDGMKAILRYAEDTVNYDDAQLSLLGWGGKAAPTSLDAPGQARTLDIVSQGEGWLTLDWKKPTDGGAVASYKIDRRERPAGDWTLISLAMESEGTLRTRQRLGIPSHRRQQGR